MYKRTFPPHSIYLNKLVRPVPAIKTRANDVAEYKEYFFIPDFVISIFEFV